MNIAKLIEVMSEQEKEIAFSVLRDWNTERNNSKARDLLAEYTTVEKFRIYQACKGNVEIAKVIRADKCCELAVAVSAARILVQDIEG